MTDGTESNAVHRSRHNIKIDRTYVELNSMGPRSVSTPRKSPDSRDGVVGIKWTAVHANQDPRRERTPLFAAAWPADNPALANALCTPHHNTAHIEDVGHTADQAASHLHKAADDRDSAQPGWERTEEIARTALHTSATGPKLTMQSIAAASSRG